MREPPLEPASDQTRYKFAVAARLPPGAGPAGEGRSRASWRGAAMAMPASSGSAGSPAFGLHHRTAGGGRPLSVRSVSTGARRCGRRGGCRPSASSGAVTAICRPSLPCLCSRRISATKCSTSRRSRCRKCHCRSMWWRITGPVGLSLKEHPCTFFRERLMAARRDHQRRTPAREPATVTAS